MSKIRKYVLFSTRNLIQVTKKKKKKKKKKLPFLRDEYSRKFKLSG